MAEKLLLVDGNNIINRAYYAVPPLTNSKGVPTGAIYGFLNSLYKYIEDFAPKYVGVAFDRREPTFRHKMFDGYKATRKPAPDDLRTQIPILKDVLKASGIAVLDIVGYEADDIIGTFSVIGEKAGLDVDILSGDRDLFQLVTDKVTQHIPRKKEGSTVTEIYTPATMMEVYGVTPTEFIEVKALQGDTSDNIPGVPGVGEKTAQALIAQYHNLEGIKEDIENVKPTRAKNSIAENFDLALLSRDLARICTEVPLDVSLDDLVVGEVFSNEAYLMLKDLEIKKLMKKFSNEEHFAESKAVSIDETPFNNAVEDNKQETTQKESTEVAELKTYKLQPPKLTYMQGMDESEVSKLFDEISSAKTIAVAFENLFDERILIITTDGIHAYAIKIAWFVTNEYIKEKLDALSVKNKIVVSGLQTLLREFDLAPSKNYFDCEIAAYLLNPVKSSYNYDDLAFSYLGGEVYPARSEIFNKKKMPAQDDQVVSEYIARQAIVPIFAHENLEILLKNDGLLDLFQDIEMPTAFRLHEMEKVGVRVNPDELKDYGEHLATEIESIEKRIIEQAGVEFNLNSPKQLGEVLFEKMGLPGGKKTKTGYSTAADVLEKLKADNPIVEDILEYRTYAKLKSTYADSLPGYIKEDGRIHGHFQQTVTATGRISSAEPNLQNIPVREELGREIRKVFVPKDGCVFIDADYSQIELRILAHLSGDKRLIEAYNSAEDIHAITASEVFGVPLAEVTSYQRRAAKAVNFGIVYGESAFGLSEGLKISRKEANDYIAQYFATYPDVKKFLDAQVASAKNLGYSTTLFGRRRPILELKSPNYMQRQFGERVAMNSPIQGTAADIMKIAMLKVTKALEDQNLKSRVVLQVHDELLLEVPEGEQDAVKKLLVEEMSSAAKLSVPLEVDVQEGASWFETH